MYRFALLACLVGLGSLLCFYSPCLAASGADSFERGLAAYTKEDYEGAKKAWEEGDAAGDIDSIMALGTYIYSAGHGTAVSPQKAFAQYLKAAKKNNAEAMSIVATCYLVGEGTTPNRSKGMEWLLKSANAGFSHAAASLGDMYAEGNNVNKDHKQAAKWHLMAADADLGPSQLYMGKANLHGWGVTKNIEEAKEWLKRAAARGEDEAKKLLNELQEQK